MKWKAKPKNMYTSTKLATMMRLKYQLFLQNYYQFLIMFSRKMHSGHQNSSMNSVPPFSITPLTNIELSIHTS